MNSFITIPLLSVGLALHSHGALSTILYDHVGDTDPTTKGWTYSTTGTTTVTAAVDGATPVWSISNTTDTDTGNYSVVPTASDTLAAAAGWSLEANLRMTESDLNPGGSMMALYRNGTRSYQMHFGMTSGQATVSLVSGIGSIFGSYTVPSGSGYNTFELLFDPGAGSADLYVNGTEQISNYTGFAFAQNLIAWGDGSTQINSHNISQAYYSNVTFSVIPEPSSALMILSGGVFLCIRRRARD